MERVIFGIICIFHWVNLQNVLLIYIGTDLLNRKLTISIIFIILSYGHFGFMILTKFWINFKFWC
jgi:hypothetical protein